MSRLAAVLALTALPVAAAADPVDVTPFIHHDGGSFFDVRGALGWSLIFGGGASVQAIDLSFQAVSSSNGFGVYGAIGGASESYTYTELFGDKVTHEETTTPLDADVGVLYRLRRGGAAVTFSAGVVAPLVSIEPMYPQDSIYGTGLFQNAEPGDVARMSQEPVLRVAVTPSTRAGHAVYAAELGADVQLGGKDQITVHGAASIGYEDDDGGMAASFGLGFFEQTPPINHNDGGFGLVLGANLGSAGGSQWWLGPRMSFGGDWGWSAAIEAGVRYSL